VFALARQRAISITLAEQLRREPDPAAARSTRSGA